MIKWTQKLHDYWKGKCSSNDLDLPPTVNDAILALLGQIEYLDHLIADGSHTHPVTEKSDKISNSNIERLTLGIDSTTTETIKVISYDQNNQITVQLTDLKNKIEILEKRISALEPKEPPTAIFYKDGKPTKKKPK